MPAAAPLRCSGTTAKRTRCKNMAIAGTDPPVCVAHAGRNGRRPKLTHEVSDRIVAILQAGNHLETAAAAGGIDPSTLDRWLARGKAGGDDPRDSPYRTFRARVEQAQAEGEAVLVTRIQKAAAQGSWQAAAWLLERRYPDRFAKPPARLAVEDTPPPRQSAARRTAEEEIADLDELAARRRTRGT